MHIILIITCNANARSSPFPKMILLHIPVHRNRLIALAETLIISDITKPNLISVLFFLVWKEVTTTRPWHGTQFDMVLVNLALRAQPTLTD